MNVIIIIGGTERLFKYSLAILKSMNFSKIVSYAYRDLTPSKECSVYTRLGFSFIGFTRPGLFYYVRNNIKTEYSFIKAGIHTRQEMQLFKLREKGLDVSSTRSLQDFQIYRVFDSGNLKFEYRL